MRPRRRADATRAWVCDLVRSDLRTESELLSQVVEAISTDLRTADPQALAEAWIAEARAAWRQDAAGWPPLTDHDRLQTAFGTLAGDGFVVLQGCADHWSARDELVRASPSARGVVWFTEPDVWHAVGEGMLEVNLWHPDTANAAPGDRLLAEVLDHFVAAGLGAHFDEGRIEVAARWQVRPRG